MAFRWFPNPSPRRISASLLLLAGLLLPAAAQSGAAPPGAVPAAVVVPDEGPGADWGGPGWMTASDQHFILLMIPHHEGAIAMADLAITRARHPELRSLAQRIARSQRTENEQMRAWYRQWFGTEVPVRPLGPGRSGRYGMGMGIGAGMGMGMGMPGLDISLAALRNAPDFDRVFIEQMIAHHRMGVMMAVHALRGTDHRELRALQEAMVRVQSQEIRLMADWYRRWFPG